MTRDHNIIDLALESFPLPTEVFSPKVSIWLTLYVVGDPDSYLRARLLLEAEGWKNLDGFEDFAGFTYPKKEVSNDVGTVRRVLTTVLAICDKTGMELDLIDADTEFNPQQSAFRTLYVRTR